MRSATLPNRRHPVALARALERWFAANARELPWRRSYDPYEILVSEMMLQQTRMEVVLPYYARWIARFPDLSSLAASDDESVLSAWSGLGYYRRARMLRMTAIAVVESHNGSIPDDVEQLVGLPGIGRYTAGAIASIAFDRPEAAVDGNAARLFARTFAVDAPAESAAFDQIVWSYARAVVESAKSPRAVNQAVMELGSRICRPKQPLCEDCPLSRSCAAFAAGSVSTLPHTERRVKPARMNIPLYIVHDERGRLLMRRESGELMSGMLHLPHGSHALYASPLKVASAASVGSFRHTITNRLITFEVQKAELYGSIGETEGDFVWVEPASLAELPHPSYVAKAVSLWIRSREGAATIIG